MTSYNFENTTKIKKITGYEDVLEELRITTPDIYKNMTQKQKDEVLNKMISIIRTKNIYPIYYFNKEGIKDEVMKCFDKEVKIENKSVGFNLNQGQHLCKQFFPNMLKTKAFNDKRTMWNKFYDDHNLKRAIDFNLRHEIFKPYNIYRALLIIGGGATINFPPMKMKALVEHYCPKGGIVYDYASGFGGRLLGTLTSKNNYTYIGVEPNTETFQHLNKFGKAIEEVTGRTKSFKILCKGSEDFNLHKECMDFMFSSPAYWCLESYSDEETQCYNKYKTLEDWLNNFARPTIQNCYDMLKKDRYYAVNIADFNLGGNRKNKIELVDPWIKMCEEIGFVHVEDLVMKLNPRRGDGHKDESGKDKKKQEGIYVFKKVK